MKQSWQNKQYTEGPVPPNWSAASFGISTTDGWLEVKGIVRLPFGIDQRSIDQVGNRSWFVTHLPSGLAVVTQVRESWLWKSEQRDKWSFCLKAARMCAAQERP